MAIAPQPLDGRLLNSWKEIAAYLGRGVRTVQRYERDLGLPVRRPQGKSHSAVIALTAELDEWLRIAPTRELRESSPLATRPAVVAALGKSVHETAELRQVCSNLRAQNAEVMRTLHENILQMQNLLLLTQHALQELSSFAPQGAGFVPLQRDRTKPN